MTNTNDIEVGRPAVAGGIPPQFQSSLRQTSLQDASWIRLPLPGARCPLTGLSRTTILELGERGKITIKRIRKPHATKGIVVVNKRSLLDFIDSLPAENAMKDGALCPA